MKHALSLALSGSCLLAATTAGAQTQDDWDGDFRADAAKRRSDFTFGGSLGGLVGSAQGFPNEVDKIDNPAFEADTGVGVGVGYKLWLGAALADWLSFGLGFGINGIQGSGPKTSSQQFLFRVETFPFFYEGPFWQDFGIHTDLGLGGTKFEEDGDEVASGGAISVVTLGAFWEPWRFGNFNAGPMAEYQHVFSSTMKSHTGLVGFRLSFYGGPGDPEPPPRRPPPRRPPAYGPPPTQAPPGYAPPSQGPPAEPARPAPPPSQPPPAPGPPPAAPPPPPAAAPPPPGASPTGG